MIGKKSQPPSESNQSQSTDSADQSGSGLSLTIPETSCPIGCEIIIEGTPPIVADIIFIHGLCGHRRKTWTKDNVFWPKELLSKEETLSRVRVLTFGYDSNIINIKGQASLSSLFDHSITLLNELSRVRKQNVSNRPVIFIAHSLGGLIVKDALDRSDRLRDTQPHLAHVFSATRGIIFFGTPHRGSHKASLATVVASVAQIALPNVDLKLIRDLERDSQILDRIRDGFSRILDKRTLTVWSFLEELASSGAGKVVYGDSAIIGDACENHGTICADHVGMAKFSSSDDSEYKKVLHAIEMLLETLPTEETNSAERKALESDHIRDEFSIPLQLNHPKIEHFMGSETNYYDSRDLRLQGQDQFNEISNASFPHFDIPSINSNFYGREDELKKIEMALGSPFPKGELRSFVIFGLGGTGKSSVALEYAHRSKRMKIYDAIFWITSETAAECRDSFGGIAVSLELPRADRNGDHENNVILVKKWFQKTTKRCLIIYDNVEDDKLFANFFPLDGANILITTRYEPVAYKSPGRRDMPLELRTFSPEHSLELFNRLRMSRDRHAVPENECRPETVELLKIVDGLPLAIEQIAAYIGFRRYTVREFLEKYKRITPRIHKSTDGNPSGHSLETLWRVQFGYVQGTLASKLLGILSMLSADGIPSDLLLPGDEKAVNDFSSFCNDEEKLEDALDQLFKVALVKRDGKSTSIHRLVSDAFFYSEYGLSGGYCQDAFDAATLLVSHRFPHNLADGLFHKWKTCATYLPHAIALLSRYNKLKNSKSPPPLRSTPVFELLLQNCAWYQFESGELHECLELLDTATDICKDKNGLLYSQLRNTAACVYYEFNDLPRCREANEECLQIREKQLGKLHTDLASTYANMGLLLFGEGRLDDALEYYGVAERTRIQLGQKNTTYLAINHLMSGRVYSVKKDYETALSYYAKCEEILRRAGKSEEWTMGSLRYARGNLELSRSNHEAAKEEYLKALDIHSEVGPNQIQTASVLYKLGLTCFALGDHTEALTFIQEGLTIAEDRRVDGEIARILRRKALFVRSMPTSTAAEKAQAEQDLSRAEELRQKVVSETQSGGVKRSYENEDEGYDSLVCGYFR